MAKKHDRTQNNEKKKWFLCRKSINKIKTRDKQRIEAAAVVEWLLLRRRKTLRKHVFKKCTHEIYVRIAMNNIFFLFAFHKHRTNAFSACFFLTTTMTTIKHTRAKNSARFWIFSCLIEVFLFVVVVFGLNANGRIDLEKRVTDSGKWW